MNSVEYSLNIMKQELNNKYICPEVKYAFKMSIKALEENTELKNIASSLRNSNKGLREKVEILKSLLSDKFAFEEDVKENGI